MPEPKSMYDNQLRCWGSNDFGQTGNSVEQNITYDSSELTFFEDEEIKFMDCGSSHTVIVTNKNKIYSWGNNSSGQLGINNAQQSFRPVEVNIQRDDRCRVAGIACGGRHTLIWYQDGSIYSFGNNFYAQLGYDFDNERYKENQLYPHFMKFLSHRLVEQASCGDKHSVFLFNDGSIAAVGSNLNGQIGSGDNMEAVVPKIVDLDHLISSIASGANHNLAITENGDVLMWGYSKACGQRRRDILSPERVEGIDGQAVEVACGATHSMALTVDGKVYLWGSGVDGQLGHQKQLFLDRPTPLPYTDQSVIHISCGEAFSSALTENGSLYVWGKNNGIIATEENPSKKYMEPVLINSTIPIQRITCGSWHIVALTGLPNDDVTTYMPTMWMLNNEDLTVADSSDKDITLLQPSRSMSVDENIKDFKNEDDIPRNQQTNLAIGKPPDSYLLNPLPHKPRRKQTIGEFYSIEENEEEKSNEANLANPDPSNILKNETMKTQDDNLNQQIETNKQPMRTCYFVEFIDASGDGRKNVNLCLSKDWEPGGSDFTAQLNSNETATGSVTGNSSVASDRNHAFNKTKDSPTQIKEPKKSIPSALKGSQQRTVSSNNIKHLNKDTNDILRKASRSSTQIGLDFQSHKNDQLLTEYNKYKDTKHISQTVFNLHDIQDLRLKNYLKQLLNLNQRKEKGAQANATEKDFQMMLKSVLPDTSPATDVPPQTQQQPLNKPPFLPRRRTLQTTSSTLTGTRNTPVKQINNNLKPVFSSASSWRKRDSNPVLPASLTEHSLHTNAIEKSPSRSRVRTEAIDRNVPLTSKPPSRPKAFSAQLNRNNSGYKILQRKLST